MQLWNEYEDLDTDMSFERFQEAVGKMVDHTEGVTNEETAAKIVADRYVDIDTEMPFDTFRKAIEEMIDRTGRVATGKTAAKVVAYGLKNDETSNVPTNVIIGIYNNLNTDMTFKSFRKAVEDRYQDSGGLGLKRAVERTITHESDIHGKKVTSSDEANKASKFLQNQYNALDIGVSLEEFHETVQEMVEQIDGLTDEETAVEIITHELNAEESDSTHWPVGDKYEALDSNLSLEEFREATQQMAEQIDGLCDGEMGPYLIPHELNVEDVNGIADINPDVNKWKFLGTMFSAGDLRDFEFNEPTPDDHREIHAEVADETGRVRIAMCNELSFSLSGDAGTDEVEKIIVGDVFRIAGPSKENNEDWVTDYNIDPDEYAESEIVEGIEKITESDKQITQSDKQITQLIRREHEDLNSDVPFEEFREAVENEMERYLDLEIGDAETVAITAAKDVAHEIRDKQFYEIEEIDSEMDQVRFSGKIVSISDLQTFDGDKMDTGEGVINFEVADETGRIGVSMQEEQSVSVPEDLETKTAKGLAVGDVLQISGRPQDAKYGACVKVEDVEVDDNTQLNIKNFDNSETDDDENDIKKDITNIQKSGKPDKQILESIQDVPRLNLAFTDIEKQDPLGSGGNADVYLAKAPKSSESIDLAIKQPRLTGTLDTEIIDQMLNEAETWQQLDDHNHIVSVIAYDSNPLPWIAMEYMDGGDLSTRVGEMPFDQAVWTALVTTKAVRHAHKSGVAHFDIKPANILFRSVEDTWDIPKVADWGLSKQLLDHSKSVEGMSPHYAAPEQFDTDQYGQTDTITDVYQLGAVFYELFTGRPPFEGSPYEIMSKIKTETPPAPSKVADIPSEIEDILLTALSTKKEERYEDVLYLRDELQTLWNEIK